MTFLGRNTVDETRHLMRTVEFRIEHTQPLLNKLSFNDSNVALIKDWNTFTERWTSVRERVLQLLLGNKLNHVLVPEHSLPAQDEYNTIMKAIGTPHEVIALSPLIGRFEVATGERLNETDKPIPEGYDPDFAAYKEVDDKIKAAEKAADEAGKAAKSAAKSNIGLLVGLGVAGIVTTVVATKVYL